jgi:MoaD family protein
MITLRLFASLRDLVGKKEVQIEQDSVMLKDLLKQFAESYGEKAKSFLFDNEGNAWQSVMLLINDQPADRDLQNIIKSGDVVSILLPTAGG